MKVTIGTALDRTPLTFTDLDWKSEPKTGHGGFNEFHYTVECANTAEEIAKATDLIVWALQQAITAFRLGSNGARIEWSVEPETDVWTLDNGNVAVKAYARMGLEQLTQAAEKPKWRVATPEESALLKTQLKPGPAW